ncbi:hypothetical protein [Bradyrhizobium ivorense]|uniref:hypothetical protein n=1 Tax=Bradyrhizobium ivorense TaxID=2511166 RepID=UPI001116D046|nr:hypothetical protein [Bradyrhizobium ivorense]
MQQHAGKNNDGANEGRDAIQPGVYHVTKVFIALTATIHLELIQVYWRRFCADTRIFADVAFCRLQFFHGKKGGFASLHGQVWPPAGATPGCSL